MKKSDIQNIINEEIKEIMENLIHYKHPYSTYRIMSQGKDLYILYKEDDDENKFTKYSLTDNDLDKELDKLGFAFKDFKKI